MKTITIPKTLLKEQELVLIPRKEYERFLLSSEKKEKKTFHVKRSSTFRVPKKHEKFYSQLDKDLTIALIEYERGEYAGPFENSEEGATFLKSKKLKKKK